MLAALERLNLDLREFVEMGREFDADQAIGTLAVQGIAAEPFKDQIDDLLSDDVLTRAQAWAKYTCIQTYFGR